MQEISTTWAVQCFGGPADGRTMHFTGKPADWFLAMGGVYERVSADAAVYTGHRDHAKQAFNTETGT